MTDLRTRIAAAIQSICIQRDGDAADAVIRELALKKVTDVNRAVPQSRYVTKWTENKSDD